MVSTPQISDEDFKRRQYRRALWAGLPPLLVMALGIVIASRYGVLTVPKEVVWRIALMPSLIMVVSSGIADSIRFGIVWTRFGVFRRDERPLVFRLSLVLLILVLVGVCAATGLLLSMGARGTF